MLAKTIEADGFGNCVLEITNKGYYVARAEQPLKRNNILDGPFENWQRLDLEISVRHLGRQSEFKLEKLDWAPSLEEALNQLRSHSVETKPQFDVPLSRRPSI